MAHIFRSLDVANFPFFAALHFGNVFLCVLNNCFEGNAKDVLTTNNFSLTAILRVVEYNLFIQDIQSGLRPFIICKMIELLSNFSQVLKRDAVL